MRANSINFARHLRQNQTDAELKVWQALRNRRLLGHKFRRQYTFHRYILDFVCLEQNFVIEVDGGQHALAAGYDEQRSQFLKEQGFTVLRFWNNEVLQNIDGVLVRISECLSHPHPSPLMELLAIRLSPLAGKSLVIHASGRGGIRA